MKHCLTHGFALIRFLPLSLANAFDKYANVDFRRLPEQFERGTRVNMDIDVIKCLSTSPIGDEDEKALRSGLSELYAQFNTALRQISRR